MTYTRTMKDGTKKVYYSLEEMDIMLEKAILKHADDLVNEIKQDKKKYSNIKNIKSVFSNNIQYV